jgi:hypothetical protein
MYCDSRKGLGIVEWVQCRTRAWTIDELVCSRDHYLTLEASGRTEHLSEKCCDVLSRAPHVVYRNCAPQHQPPQTSNRQHAPHHQLPQRLYSNTANAHRTVRPTTAPLLVRQKRTSYCTQHAPNCVGKFSLITRSHIEFIAHKGLAAW